MLQKLYKMPLLNYVKHIAAVCGVTICSLFINFNAVAQDTTKYFTVVIDPGHGGKDPGAIGKISYEKDIALDISLLVGKYLEENIDSIRVIYTRKTDVYPELYRRAEIANENDADLFISIHVNANDNTRATGASSHVLGLHRADESFEVAKRENSVILLEDDYTTRYEGFDPNSEESYIIFSFMANFYDNQSVLIAKNIQDQFSDRAHRNDRGVIRQGLLVLALTSMPGVLIETGFITNPEEEKYLNSTYGQEIIASAIYRAVKEYKNHIESAQPEGKNEIKGNIAKNPQIAIPAETPETEESEKKNITGESETVEVFFKVQVLASKNPINIADDIFVDLNDVEEFYENGKYKYTVGFGSTYEEIKTYSKMVKNRFPDSFIVGVEDGKIVSAKSIRKKIEDENIEK